MAIVAGAFRMEENIRQYIGANVVRNGTMIGRLVGPFAKLGKCKVDLIDGATVALGVTVDIDLSSQDV